MDYDRFFHYFCLVLGIILICQGLVLVFGFGDFFFILLGWMFWFVLALNIGVYVGFNFLK